MKQFLVKCWNLFFDYYIILRNGFHLWIDTIYQKLFSPPTIASIEETIQYIIEKKCSASRLGDGEIKIAAGKTLAFQEYSVTLQKRMQEVLSHPIPNHIVCLPDIFSNLSIYNEEAHQHWELHLAYYRKKWYQFIDRKHLYHNAFISRCYMMFIDKSHVGMHFNQMKRIWDNKDILLIEGEKSRLGVGNDLFDNVKSIQRILAPNRNAFQYYQALFDEVCKYNPSDYLILLALGPTATILAYDLALKGYQAIDIGHIDIEYEWFRMGATHKVPVPNKFVNEAGAGVGVGDIDNKKYLSEIVCRF